MKGYGKSSTFQLLPGVLKSLSANCHGFPPRPLFVVILPHLSAVEDHGMYFRSLRIETGYIGDNKTKDKKKLYGKEGGRFIVKKPRGNVLKGGFSK